MNGVQRQSRLGLIKGFIQQGRHSTSLHKDKTVTTNAFEQTKDARQDANNAGSRESYYNATMVPRRLIHAELILLGTHSSSLYWIVVILTSIVVTLRYVA